MGVYQCQNEPMEVQKGFLIYFDGRGLQPVGPRFL